MKRLIPLSIMLALYMVANAQVPNNAEASLTTLYISNAGAIIDCPMDQNDLFEFADAFNYNHFILYGIKNYVKDLPSVNVEKLGQFIFDAHQNGITISINVSSYNGSVDIRNYWDQQSHPEKKYDGLHLEKEFWAGTGSQCSKQQVPFQEYMDELTAIYNFCHGYYNGTAPRGILCETYLSNPCHKNSRPAADGQEQVNQIVQYSDRVYLAYYKKSPFSPSKGIFHSKLYRLDYFCNATDNAGNPINADVAILFNAYQDDPTENDDMFNWLNDMADEGTLYEELFALPYDYWMNGEYGYHANRDQNINNLNYPKSDELFNLNILGYGWYKYQALQEVVGQPVGNCDFIQQPLFTNKTTQNLIQPIPAINEVKINLPNYIISGEYAIISLSGKLILKGTLFDKKNLINVSDLKSGVYVLIVEGNNSEQLVEKLIVEKN